MGRMILYFSLALLIGCQDQVVKQQDKQVERPVQQAPAGGYASTRWKCPYCGIELSPFDTFIMDHKQGKCSGGYTKKASSYEEDVEDAYKKGYEEGLEKGNKEGFDKGYEEGISQD